MEWRVASFEGLDEEVESLVSRIVSLAQDREGRLAGLAFELPARIPAESFQRALTVRLASSGFDRVDIRTQRGFGSIRLISAEFER
jgi:hypothetical protein